MINLSDNELRKLNRQYLDGPRGENQAAVQVFTELDRRFEKLYGSSPEKVKEQIAYYRRRFAFTLTDVELNKSFQSLRGKRARVDVLWRTYFEDEIKRRVQQTTKNGD